MSTFLDISTHTSAYTQFELEVEVFYFPEITLLGTELFSKWKWLWRAIFSIYLFKLFLSRFLVSHTLLSYLSL